jgi:hypothetical protein
MRRPSIAFARAHHCAAALPAECRLILPKAQAPQPDHNVHEGALIAPGRTIGRARKEV